MMRKPTNFVFITNYIDDDEDEDVGVEGWDEVEVVDTDVVWIRIAAFWFLTAKEIDWPGNEADNNGVLDTLTAVAPLCCTVPSPVDTLIPDVLAPEGPADTTYRFKLVC